MQLALIDWAIIFAVMAVAVGVGAAVAHRAGRDKSQFFLSGRSLSGVWLGLSMVATTFAADTPGLVTQLVREDGIAGNWRWWALLLTGMLTVFLYARLWRRSGVTTDLEFYELRYSGTAASALRAFRAIYLGVVFNVIVMAIVSLAAIKIGQIMLGLSPRAVLMWGGVATLLFSTTGGFRAVVLTDCLLFVVSMGGAIAAAYFALAHPDVGGLANLLTNEHVTGKLNFVPAWDWSDAGARETLLMVFIIPLAVQWWSMWYPGAEPGGGGGHALQCRPLRFKAVAMDLSGPGVASGLSATCRPRRGVSPHCRRQVGQRSCLSCNANLRPGRLARINHGVALGGLHVDDLHTP